MWKFILGVNYSGRDPSDQHDPLLSLVPVQFLFQTCTGWLVGWLVDQHTHQVSIFLILCTVELDVFGFCQNITHHIGPIGIRPPEFEEDCCGHGSGVIGWCHVLQGP